MKEIKLTQGKIALVDDEDFERLNQFKWYAYFDRYNHYATRRIIIGEKSKLIRMHREILNTHKGVHVDHINCNGLDNRKANLRLCTNQQNSFNRKDFHKNNKLGIKGVYWDEKRKKFAAKIHVNYKSIRLGFYNILGDADSAYRKAENEYFGKFARITSK